MSPRISKPSLSFSVCIPHPVIPFIVLFSPSYLWIRKSTRVFVTSRRRLIEMLHPNWNRYREQSERKKMDIVRPILTDELFTCRARMTGNCLQNFLDFSRAIKLTMLDGAANILCPLINIGPVKETKKTFDHQI